MYGWLSRLRGLLEARGWKSDVKWQKFKRSEYSKVSLSLFENQSKTFGTTVKTTNIFEVRIQTTHQFMTQSESWPHSREPAFTVRAKTNLFASKTLADLRS
jgi:hypothetical protein